MKRVPNLAETGTNEEWVSEIKGIRAEVESSTGFGSEKEAVSALKKILYKSVEAVGKFSVLFSGGLDSTLIAFFLKQRYGQVRCYTVGTSDSDDVKWAERVANKFGFNLSMRILSENEIERTIARIVRILNDTNPANVGVASVMYTGIEIAGDSDVIFSGLGSEEIFAGYHRHADAQDINAECWNGLYNMWARDMVRDKRVAAEFGVRLKFPFLEREIVKAAMLVPGEWKIHNSSKKYILRELAKEIGIPEEVAERPKKAAQYGSFIDKVMERLAKRAGFRYKRDYLCSLLRESSSGCSQS